MYVNNHLKSYWIRFTSKLTLFNFIAIRFECGTSLNFELIEYTQFSKDVEHAGNK